MRLQTTRPATEKQRAFVTRLLAEKDLTGTIYDGWTPDWSRATTATASQVIEALLALPRKDFEFDMTARRAEPEAGVYRDGEQYYRVYFGQQSGKMLLKRLVRTDHYCAGHYDNLDGSYFECGVRFPTTEQSKDLSGVEDEDMPLRDVGCVRSTWEYEYVGLASKHLPASAKPLPLEEAKAWGRLTSTCVVCGRALDVPESVDAGIGPKCAKAL